jgi:RNA polymerase sigma factor for flagellar operon FliA
MASLDFKHLWVRYKSAKDLAARDELITRYAYLVNITVGRAIVNLPPTLDREDLISAGTMGLIKAVDQFDLGREVKFETYGITLIRGALLEMLREQDWVPRSIRDRVKAAQRATAACELQLGRPPTEVEIADALEMDLDQYHRLLSETGRTTLVSLDEVLLGTDDGSGVHLGDALADTGPDIGEYVETKERLSRLAAGVDSLPTRERTVIALYYREGLTFKEIGRVLEVSESRSFQLHSQAINRMRKYLTEDAVLFR